MDIVVREFRLFGETSPISTATEQRRLPLGLFPDRPVARLYDCSIALLHSRHYVRRTEEAYFHGIRRLILFRDRRHTRQLGEDDVNRFLSHLGLEERVAAATQNQGLSARTGLAKSQDRRTGPPPHRPIVVFTGAQGCGAEGRPHPASHEPLVPTGAGNITRDIQSTSSLLTKEEYT
ncbi:MAG: phage integrase N-terminal SAM-like domain-containing protein [Pirellulales bacterium]|nr:phage integrase N-terminal SAM-like domain-containing protein [Pirellulales bacterium]